jgi:dihydroorotase
VFQNLEDINVDASVKVIETGEEHIWGIAVNLSSAATGSTDAREIMHRTMIIAERANCPILFGPRRDPFDWPLAEQLDLLRPGDVVTYCFHRDGRLLGNNGRIMDGVQRARDRGVLFDVGHGMASFDFGVAETAIAQGFLPDTISTDVYKRHLGINPTHDMPLMVSKLMAAGVSEREAFTRGTATAARALDLAGEIGTLAPGASADVAVLHWNPESGLLADVNGVTRRGGRWEPVLTIRGGQVVKP